MRNIAAYIEKARATCTPRRHIVLSEINTLLVDYYQHGKPYPGEADAFGLIGACFYFGFAVGLQQGSTRP